jgi:CDP-diacylglycerol--glycerol-3-phosphate 3-phosphatidyltransferase
MTTANKITIARILMIPVFVTLAVYYGRGLSHGAPQEWQRWSAVAVFILAAASDGVDGYIARHFNQRSRLGVILDPLADKGLLLAGIVTLSVSNWAYEIPVWFPVVVISRDMIVVIGVVLLHILNGSVSVRANRMGKWSTALQMVALVLVMLQLNPPIATLGTGSWQATVHFLDLPIWLAGIFTGIAAVGYFLDGLGQLHAHGDPAKHDQSVTMTETNPASAAKSE